MVQEIDSRRKEKAEGGKMGENKRIQFQQVVQGGKRSGHPRLFEEKVGRK